MRSSSTPSIHDSQMSSINNIHVVKTLNKGAFAEVYKAIEISTGKTVALKVVSAKRLIIQQKLDAMFANEITLMKKITHHKINGITFNTI